jgi:hypothetical protein
MTCWYLAQAKKSGAAWPADTFILAHKKAISIYINNDFRNME